MAARAADHELFGVMLSVEDVARVADVNLCTVYHRLKRGMSAAEIVASPVQRPGDMTGQRFGALVVTGEHPERTAAGKRRFACDCDCGKTVTVVGADLRSGRTVSCGHIRIASTRAVRLARAEDITGKVFGDVEVLGPGDLVPVSTGSGMGRQWICLCRRCGSRFEARAANLRKGQTTSCGCRRREIDRARRENAPRYELMGQWLTVRELEELTGVNAMTLRYRLLVKGMSAEEAAFKTS